MRRDEAHQCGRIVPWAPRRLPPPGHAEGCGRLKPTPRRGASAGCQSVLRTGIVARARKETLRVVQEGERGGTSGGREPTSVNELFLTLHERCLIVNEAERASRAASCRDRASSYRLPRGSFTLVHPPCTPSQSPCPLVHARRRFYNGRAREKPKGPSQAEPSAFGTAPIFFFYAQAVT